MGYLDKLQSLTYPYSARYFAYWRICFGIFLTVYFFRLVPYAPELFSRDGMLPEASANWTYGIFPSLLYWNDSREFATALLVVLAILSGLLALGVFRRTSALLLWVGWASLFNRNNLTQDPSLEFVGLLLLVLCIVPNGEPFSVKKVSSPAWRLEDSNWHMPGLLFWGVWGIFALSFSISGFEKFQSPSWREGVALRYFYESALAFDTVFVSYLRSLPDAVITFKTWLTMYSQLLALPALFFLLTRKLFWLVTTGLFAMSLFILGLTDVVIGMILFYFFLFDPRWVQLRPAGSAQPVAGMNRESGPVAT